MLLKRRVLFTLFVGVAVLAVMTGRATLSALVAVQGIEPRKGAVAYLADVRALA